MKNSRKTKEAIIQAVAKDLNPSFLRVACYLMIAFSAGGVLSMFVCGQFGIGLSSFALHMSHKFHSEMDPLLCSFYAEVSLQLFRSLF